MTFKTIKGVLEILNFVLSEGFRPGLIFVLQKNLKKKEK